MPLNIAYYTKGRGGKRYKKRKTNITKWDRVPFLFTYIGNESEKQTDKAEEMKEDIDPYPNLPQEFST